MTGMPRSLCSVSLDTYHGAFVIALSIFDWSLCIVLFVLLAQSTILSERLFTCSNLILGRIYKRCVDGLKRTSFNLGCKFVNAT
jgi:hypothetical protein